MPFPENIQDVDQVKTMEKLDYAQLVFLCIRSIIAAPIIELYIVRVGADLRGLLTPHRKKNTPAAREYQKKEDEIFENYKEALKGLDPNELDERVKIQRAEIERAQKLFEALMILAGKIGLLGEERITEQI